MFVSSFFEVVKSLHADLFREYLVEGGRAHTEQESSQTSQDVQLQVVSSCV